MGEEAFDNAEQLTQQIIQQARQQRNAMGKNLGAPFQGDILTIPVVIHVIHNGGDEQISYEQAVSQVEAFNRDFRRWPGTIGFGQGVDCGIEFSLATKDPQGNPTSGVNYIQSPETEHPIGDPALKALVQWPPDQYLNCWVVANIIGGSQGGRVLGYAQFPGGNASTDGIVVIYDAWGTTGALQSNLRYGRVGTHEIGHYLNLAHTFQSGCGGDCQFTSDRICDTPPTNQANYSFPGRLNSCTNEAIDRADQTRNYMDYTSGLAKDQFTQGQADRMRAALQNPAYDKRIELWSASNLFATGTGPHKAPSVYFYPERRFTSPGQPIQFWDYSYDSPTQWSWSFEGGTPATAGVQNPIVSYDQPGTYDVSLYVTNDNGTSDTLVMEHLIVVRDSVASLPFFEGFTSVNFPPEGWFLDNQDVATFNNDLTWSFTAVASGFDTSFGCARMSHYYYNGYGQKDGLVLPDLDLSGKDVARLDFSRAYAATQFNEQGSFPRLFTDTLSVYASTDGGSTWSQVYHKGGADLATTEPFTGIFNQPTVQEWSSDSVDLSAFAGASRLTLKFEATNGYGNNLYLDDIRVTSDSLRFINRTPKQALEQQLAVYPNPSSGQINLQWKGNKALTGELQVMDVQGRKVFQRQVQLPGNREPLAIQLGELSNGIYTLKLQTASGLFVKKLLLK